MSRILRALFAVTLLFATACGGDDDDTGSSSGGDEPTSEDSGDSGDTAGDDASGDDDSTASDDDGDDSDDGGGSISEDEVGTATLTIEPEGETYAVGSSCEFNTESFSGIVSDLSDEGTSVSFAFDNASDEAAAFLFNVVSTGTVGADGTFVVRSRGGLDNQSVNFNGTGTAEIIEADGTLGRVRLQLDLVQAGPTGDPSGPPVFDDQPTERTITGEAICTLGIS